MAEVPNRTLQRGLQLLELLGKHPEGLTLAELTQMLSLPRSTGFNLAQSLVKMGYAFQSEDTGKYRLGLKMFETGASAVQQMDVMEIIRTCMTKIHGQINETMHLGVRSGTETIYIDKRDSTQSIRMSSYVGAHAPLHCTSLGKAILSTYSDDEIRQIYDGREQLPAITEHTITDMAHLLSQMNLIRQTGYAVEREENNANVACVAVPLRNQSGRALYALSISAPLFRMGEEQMKSCAQLLLEVQPRIERFLREE